MIDTHKIMNLLNNLSENNNREWFHSHAFERKEATTEFEFLVEELELQITKFDKTISYFPPKELTFKQVRDTRFSKDKSPYNPSFRAHIAENGKLPIPTGYFICLKTNNESFIGGGLFTDIFQDATYKIRDYIYNHQNEFLEIISNETFSKNFVIKGTKLKNVPKIYNANSSVAEYLKYKSWYLEYQVTDHEILDSEKFIDMILEKFELMKDFNHFLNRALIDFEMPKR